jgi:hypothetical protein
LKLITQNSELRICFSFPVLLGALLVAAVLVTLPRYPHDPDTWWHITVGEHILRTHSWPTTDAYSFTAFGNDWIAHEWLGEVPMALAARLGGLAGLALLRVGLAASFMLLVYYYAHVRSRNAKAAFVAAAVFCPLVLGFLWLRPQLLGYLFLGVTLICLERFSQGYHRALWPLPAVFLLWVNTHGTFTLGLAAVCLYWACGLVPTTRGSGFGVRGSAATVNAEKVPQGAVEGPAGADLNVAGASVSPAAPAPNPGPRTLFHWGGLEAKQWTDRQRRQLLVIALLCVVALLFTPYGTRLAAYPLEFASSQFSVTAHLGEWQPLSFGEPWAKVVLLLLLLFVLAQVLFRAACRLEEIALLLFATYAACVHRRFFLFFALVFAPAFATLLSRWVPNYEPQKDRYALNALLILALAAFEARSFPSRQELDRQVADTYPAEAVEYLRGHPVPARLFNDYRWGGFLIWALGGERRVFIDGRADAYAYSGVYSDYFRIMTLDPETLSLLRKYETEACLVEPFAPLAVLLRARPEWEQVYGDGFAVIFVRKQSALTTEALWGLSTLATSTLPQLSPDSR